MSHSVTLGYHYQARNPAALRAPITPKLDIRSACTVLGWSPRFSAEFRVSRDTNNLAGAEAGYAAARKALGQANRFQGAMRRFHLAAAFRALNQRRGSLIRARKALALSQAALAALPA